MLDYNKYLYLQNYLLENTTIKEVPQTIVDTLLEQEEGNFTNAAAMNGLPLEYLLSIYGYESIEDFRADFTESAMDQIKLQMIFEAIAQKENMTISTDDLKNTFGDSYETLISTYGETHLKRQAMLNKASTFVMDSTTIA